MSRTSLRIGEIARLLGVTPKTVRHYHKLGLILEPSRSEGGYRLYTTADLFHLQRIRRLQSLGLSLRQIKFILDADDPDDLLCVTLQGLQKELAAQQARIAERRERIQRYLEEGVSLAVVEQPEADSPTYALLKSQVDEFPGLPASLVDFDKQVFGQLDAFNWGEDYASGWQSVAAYFDPQSEYYAEVTRLFSRIIALQNMSVDDPQVQIWAEESRQSSLFKTLSSGAVEFGSPDLPLTEVTQHIFARSAEQHLSPAQRRFLELLVS